MKKSIQVATALSIFLAWAPAAFADPAPRPLTTDGGAPVGSNQFSKTAGPRDGVLLEDFHLIEKLARFDRERTSRSARSRA